MFYKQKGYDKLLVVMLLVPGDDEDNPLLL